MTVQRRAVAVAPYLALLAEVLLFFRKVLFGSEHVFPWDFRGYHLPLNEYLARSLREGTLPFWDPYTYCGVPQFANPQAQTFYPPALLFAAIGAWWGEDKMLALLNWQNVLHVFLAGAFVYALLRRRGLGEWPALLGASVFQMGGFYASHVQHLGLINAVAWAPLAMFAVDRAAVVAFAFAMTILAGFTPAVPVVLATVFAYGGPRRWPRLLLATAWAAALAAIQLVPTMELVGLTQAARRYELFGFEGGMLWQGLVSLVWPNRYGVLDVDGFKLVHNPTFHYLYSGIGALGLALLARERWLWVFTAVFAAATLGYNTPIGAALYPLVPGPVRSGIYLEYFAFPFLLGISMLAAHGAARLGPKRAIVACAVCVADLVAMNSGIRFNAALTRDDPGVTTGQFEGSAETLSRLRALVGRSLPPERIDIRDDSMNWASSAAVLRVPTANGNDPLVIDRYQSVRALYSLPRYGHVRYLEPENLDSPIASMLNVGYLLTWGPNRLEHPKWPLAEVLPGHDAHRNSEVLPRFYLVGRVLRSHSRERSLKMISDPAFDPASVAVVEGDAVSEGGGKARVVSYRPTLVRLASEAERASFLVSSEVDYPGWVARIDGRAAPIVPTNVAFRGVAVPAGKHEIEFEFRPAWLAGAGISAVAAFILLASLR